MEAELLENFSLSFSFCLAFFVAPSPGDGGDGDGVGGNMVDVTRGLAAVCRVIAAT